MEQSAQSAEAEREQFNQKRWIYIYQENERIRIQEDNNIRDNETKLLLEEIRSYANLEYLEEFIREVTWFESLLLSSSNREILVLFIRALLLASSM